MSYKKEHLEGLLKLIDEVAKTPGNEWFVERIQKSTILKSNIEINIGIDDIKRTRFYMKNVDKTFYMEGFNFYRFVKNSDAKKRLIADYKEMKIALANNDFLEYGRRMCIQLERCFDLVIMNLDVIQIIKTDVRYLNKVFIPRGPITLEFDFKKFFPQFDSVSRQQSNKGIYVDFKLKAMFCFIYYEVDYIRIWQNFEDIYYLRNMASHGIVSPSEDNRLGGIFSKIQSNIGFYYRLFSQLIEKFTIIYNK